MDNVRIIIESDGEFKAVQKKLFKVENLMWSTKSTKIYDSPDYAAVVQVTIIDDMMEYCTNTCKNCSILSGCNRKTDNVITAKEFLNPPGKEKQYRIKTEQEFIDEFGEKWVRIVNWNNEGGMDFLFGQEVGMNTEHTVENWYIQENMITDKPLPVEQEQFKFGDEVWIKGSIRHMNSSGNYNVEIKDHYDAEEMYFKADQLHKSIPNLNKDTDPIKQLGESVKPIVPRHSTIPQKASIMFGDSDLNHEDIDDDDLIRGKIK